MRDFSSLYYGWEKKRSGFRQKAEPFNIQMSAALCRDAATPEKH
jgi:hypothetical protein